MFVRCFLGMVISHHLFVRNQTRYHKPPILSCRESPPPKQLYKGHNFHFGLPGQMKLVGHVARKFSNHTLSRGCFIPPLWYKARRLRTAAPCCERSFSTFFEPRSVGMTESKLVDLKPKQSIFWWHEEAGHFWSPCWVYCGEAVKCFSLQAAAKRNSPRRPRIDLTNWPSDTCASQGVLMKRRDVSFACLILFWVL